jgi:hypothetical protein
MRPHPRKRREAPGIWLVPAFTWTKRLGLPVSENEETRKKIEIRQAISSLSLDLFRGTPLATELMKRHRSIQGDCLRNQIRDGIEATKEEYKTHPVLVRRDPNAGQGDQTRIFAKFSTVPSPRKEPTGALLAR